MNQEMLTIPSSSANAPTEQATAPTPAAIARAARAMRGQSEALRLLRTAQVASFTIDPLLPYLDVGLAREGFLADTYVAPFNSIHQQLLSPDSALATHQPDVVFVAALLEDVSPQLAHDYLSLSAKESESLCEQIVVDLQRSLVAFRRRSAAPIVVNNFALPTMPLLGIYEPQARDSQTEILRRLNGRLVDELGTIAGVYVLDFDRLCAEVGYRQWRSERQWHLGRAPFAEPTLQSLAEAQVAFVRALHGIVRKCLVVDLDNTLWGGVVGDQGWEGLQLGNTFPGSVFLDIQRALVQLSRRGVLLAINSKNNPDDVEAAFKRHPDMLLRTEHFAASRINWLPKPENMRSLAEELGLGLDSLVFLDDSPSERLHMRQALPQVLTLEHGGESYGTDPLHILQALRETRVFDRLSLTVEDRQRGEMYQQQARRRELEQSTTSVDDFLYSLELKVQIEPANSYSLPRITELIHKTNQFNLTTRRHSAGALSRMSNDDRWRIFSLRAWDRFGDCGIVGVALVELQGEVARLDSFLLSCRVIGRTLETAFLAWLADWAQKQGALELAGEFIPTTKNAPAADFFCRHGFVKRDANSQGNEQWSLPLNHLPFEWPTYIDIQLESTTAPPTAKVVNDDTMERLYHTVADVLGVDVRELTDDSSPRTVPNWDSLNHLNLVMAVEAEFGVVLSAEDALAMQSIQAIREVLCGDRPSGSSAIRLADCQMEDLRAFKEFVAATYGPDYVLGADDAYFQWQYGRLPGDQPGRYRLRLAWVDGQIAGCLGYVPVEVTVAGRIVRGCWLANWMVAEPYRKFGIGPLLVRDVSQPFEVTLALGANREAQQVLTGMGWTDLGMLKRYVRVLDRAQAAKLTESGRLSWPVAEDVEFTAATAGMRVERVERFHPEVGDVWDRTCGGNRSAAGTRRTASFLNWRYADHANFPYRLLQAVGGDGRVGGLAAYRIEPVRDVPVKVGRLVELLGEEPAMEALLAAVLAEARDSDAALVDFFCGTDSPQGVLANQGFIAGDNSACEQIPILYQPIDRRRAGIRFLADLRGIPNTETVTDWYVTKADGDQDRPN